MFTRELQLLRFVLVGTSIGGVFLCEARGFTLSDPWVAALVIAWWGIVLANIWCNVQVLRAGSRG